MTRVTWVQTNANEGKFILEELAFEIYFVVPGSTADVIKVRATAMYLQCCKAGPFVMEDGEGDPALLIIAFDVASDGMGVRPCPRRRGLSSAVFGYPVERLCEEKWVMSVVLLSSNR